MDRLAELAVLLWVIPVYILMLMYLSKIINAAVTLVTESFYTGVQLRLLK